MYSLECGHTEALDNFQACNICSSSAYGTSGHLETANISFSPICHRTRGQLAKGGRSCVPCKSDPSSVDNDIRTDGLAFESVIIEQEVIETLSDMLNSIPPGDLFFDESSPLRCLGLSSRTKIPSNLFNCVCRPAASSMTSYLLQHRLVHFPKLWKVTVILLTLVGMTYPSLCLFLSHCRRRFFSAGGLENHLYAVHGINLDTHEHTPIGTGLLPMSDVLPPSELLSMGPTTGPPKCAPFSQASPAKTWASAVHKPAVSSTQPWAGKPIHSQTAVSTTPRRPRSSGGPVKSSLHAASPPVKKGGKISFRDNPDETEHVVLLPVKPSSKKKRKVLPCPRCDFTFHTVKSRDEHLVVHSLEDEFNPLHGIVSSSNNADFDDFVLPKSPHPQSLPKQSKSLAVQDLATTSSTLQAQSSAPATAASLPLICDFCDKRGFPSRKALKYHLFRLHGQPMRKKSQQQASSSSLQAHSMTPPAGPIHPASSVQRLDAQISMSLPIQGKVVCPEQGCEASFVSKQWTSMKGSLIKHLRFVHRVSIATCLFQCDICRTSFSGKPREHSCFTSDDHPIVIDVKQELQCPQCEASFSSALGLQNHSKAHLRQTALSQVTPLHIPASRRRKRSKRKTRASSSPLSDTAQDCVTEVSQLLAPPVADVPLVDAAPPPSEHEDAPLFHFSQIFQDILTCDPSHDCARLLSDAYCQLVTEASSIALPKQSVPVPFSQAQPLNIEDPQQCQRLYKRNRRRAIREIQKTAGERCSISPNAVAEFFSAIWQPSPSDSRFYSAPSSEREEVLNLPLSVAEVMIAFRSCENTAPGPDRLTYNHWRSVDPRATILTRLFNCCLHVRLIPEEWTQSTTILIPKAGDPSSLANWRPIALGNTAYKLFMKCLTARLQNWCQKFDVLSPCQKGFTPFDRVLEHNFVLQRRIEKARSSKSHLCVAFLDISNAFGSLPHSAIRDCLQAIGVGDTFLHLVLEAYSSILTADTRTESIKISCGVKQGCALSGLLFNLCIDPVLRAIQGDAAEHRVLAFADDLVLLADSADQLQANLHRVNDLLHQISLSLNPAKCKSLHICAGVPAGVRNTSFSINGLPIPAMAEFDHARFLGKPVGFMRVQNTPALMT
ncbi:retrovirus-related Pol polyprotein from type-1 retrotransposable element R2 [Caerostris darwini]|uniref:Retrovirus-related Pol polyprotein from type-1 retrotransposable element R2 n=1 Tax=Caerostris darwini TaxID=1538125 RepID=A0AAV4M8Z2_9ARAC|nr:retrovirus-related Pol polyprotein from type-1 retrotransposable element R2 [Caerostris darwini]